MIFQLTASQGGWQLRGRVLFDDILFQLTASQGGWPDYSICGTPQFHFNSQPHKEADESWLAYNRMVSHISTHSLTRRLTEHMGRYLMMCKIFQLTASQGGWHLLVYHKTKFLYISTHSLTRRLTVLTTATVPQQYISTHSLTRRLTEIWRKVKMLSQISTHSLTRRLTIFRSYTIIVRWISTHSLTRRLTAMLASSDVATLFQLTASQGGWQTAR